LAGAGVVEPVARIRDLATLQDFFVKMGWVKQPVPVEHVVDLTFLE